MKISSPSAIKISIKDIGEFTSGKPGLDLIDITGIGSNAASVASPADQKITKNPAQLDDKKNFVNNPGAYVYRFDMSLDLPKIQQADIDGIMLEIFNEKPTNSFADDFDDIQNILNKSKAISNSVNSKSQQNMQVFIDYRPDIVRARGDITVGDVNEFSFRAILDKPIPNVSTKLQKAIKIAPKQSKDVIDVENTTIKQIVTRNFLAGLDAFADLNKFENSDSAESISSLSNDDTSFFDEDVIRIKSTDSVNEVSLATIRKLMLEEDSIASAKNESTKEKNKTIELLKDKPQQLGGVNFGYIANLTTTKFRVVRDIEIPKSLIGQRQKFYVRVKPVLINAGRTTSLTETVSATFSVNHGPQVQEMLEPVVPPTIKVLHNRPSKIILKIVQKDPTTKSVKITRRIFDPRTQKLLNTKSFSAESDIITDFDVENIAPNKVYYTTSALNNDGTSGPSSSLVVDGVYTPNIKVIEDDTSPVVHATNLQGGINVVVENIPPEINFVRVMKEKQSVPGDLKSRTSAITDATGASNILVDGRKRIRLRDNDVADNHAYRYYAILQSGIGSGYVAENDDVIIRRFPRYELPYDIIVGEPQQVNGAVNTTVKIDLLASQKKSSFNFFIGLLQNSGADKFFLDEIKKQRNSFTDVIAFLITRIDTSTGQKVSLGIHKPGTFFDIGSKSTASAIKPGRKYVYKIKVCIKPIESFFTNLFSSLTNPKQTSGTEVTRFLSKKFLNTVNQHLGVIPSDFELRQSINPSTQLTAAETGLTYTKTLRTGLTRAKIHSFKRILSKSKNQKAVKMAFSISGNLRAVLYAVAICESRSGQKIIKKMTVNPDIENYFFVDKNKFNEVGTKTYKVFLVYTDFKKSPLTKGIVVKKQHNIAKPFVSKLISNKGFK